MKVALLTALAALSSLGSPTPLQERGVCVPGADPNNPNACWPPCASLCGQGNCPNGYTCSAASRCDEATCCGQCMPAGGAGFEGSATDGSTTDYPPGPRAPGLDTDNTPVKRQFTFASALAAVENCQIPCDPTTGDIPEGQPCNTVFDFGTFFGGVGCTPCSPPSCEEGLACYISEDFQECGNGCAESWSGTCQPINATNPARRSFGGLPTHHLARRDNVQVQSVVGIGGCAAPEDDDLVCITYYAGFTNLYLLCNDPNSDELDAGVCYTMCATDEDRPCSCEFLAGAWCNQSK